MDSLGGLPVKVEHVPHAVHTSTRSGTSTTCNESRPLALRDEETAWSGDSGHGTKKCTQAQSDSHPRVGEVSSMSSELPHTWKSEYEPTPRLADVRQYDPKTC